MRSTNLRRNGIFQNFQKKGRWKRTERPRVGDNEIDKDREMYRRRKKENDAEYQKSSWRRRQTKQ